MPISLSADTIALLNHLATEGDKLALILLNAHERVETTETNLAVTTQIAEVGSAANQIHMVSAALPTNVERLVLVSNWGIQDTLWANAIQANREEDAPTITDFNGAVCALATDLQNHFQDAVTFGTNGAHLTNDAVNYLAIDNFKVIAGEIGVTEILNACAEFLIAHANQKISNTDWPSGATRDTPVHFNDDTVTAAYTPTYDPSTDPVLSYREIFKYFYSHRLQGLGLL